MSFANRSFFYAASSSSFTTSLSSSVREYRQENGRRYHGFRDGRTWEEPGPCSSSSCRLSRILPFRYLICDCRLPHAQRRRGGRPAGHGPRTLPDHHGQEALLRARRPLCAARSRSVHRHWPRMLCLVVFSPHSTISLPMYMYILLWHELADGTTAWANK